MSGGTGKSISGGVAAGLMFVVLIIIIGACLGYKGNEVPGPDVTVYEQEDCDYEDWLKKEDDCRGVIIAPQSPPAKKTSPRPRPTGSKKR